MMFNMWKIVILVGISALVIPWIYRYVKFQGYYSQVFQHHPGPCRRLPRIENGSEDMQLLSNNKVLITSGFRFLFDHPPYIGVTGRIYLFDLDKPQQSPVDVTIKGDLDLITFNPVGISSWEDKESKETTIFIINLISPMRSTVEMFRFAEKEKILYHIETIHTEHFIFLNNLVVVGPRQFYFTNLYNTYRDWEMMIQLYWAYVGFYDGHNSQPVAHGMLLANGIAISPDGRYVYVSHMFDKELRIYSRKKDNSLDLKEAVPLYMANDNMFVDQQTGDIWVTGSPHVYKAFAYLSNPKNELSTSQVLKLRVEDGHVTDITEVLVDDGRLHSASTVSIYKDNKLLVGSVATSALYCDVRYI